VRLAAGFYGVVLLFAVGYATFSGTISTLFGERAPGGGTLLAAVVVGFGIVGLSRLGAVALPTVDRAADALHGLLGPISWRTAIVLALLSGVAEELLFRGALWPHLGLWGTTFLFGLVHVMPSRALLFYPLFALVAGLLLGFLRQGGGNVLPAMLAHAIVNAWNLAWIGARRPATPSR
jgi:membrane protease YdiL (CAAX protease family)